MGTQLDHSPAEVVRQLLIDLSLGEDSQSSDWSVFVGVQPDSPDNCITVYDTTGILDGKVQFTGDTLEQHGVQIKIRARTVPLGRARSNLIGKKLDQDVQRTEVTVDSDDYLVHGVQRGNILHLGHEPESRNRGWSINCTCNITSTGTGTG